jgi:nucleotide-binding universal stress UspA family protein
MSGRLLVALDGTSEGAAALELALRWSKRFEAKLLGLAIVDEPSIRRPEPLPIGASYFKSRSDERRLAQARARADALLEDFERRCASAGAAFDVLEELGSPDERILTDSHRCDLILLGRRARFREAGGRDTTMERVLRRSPRPVVAVPTRLPDSDDVLIAYDGSPHSARALRSFQAFFGSGFPRIHVVSVHADGRQAADRARTALDYLSDHGLLGEERALASSRPPEEILLRAARELQAGLIVMGAFGRPRLREALLGSVTRSLLRASPVPLFLDR